MTGRVLLVTGASSGIGRAVRRGWAVVLTGRSKPALSKVACGLDSSRVLVVAADVQSWPDSVRVTKSALERFGRLDAVVTSAGVGVPEGMRNGTPEQWRELVLTSLLGTAYSVRATLPELTRRAGHYVLIGSVAGRDVMRGWMYSVVKHGVSGLAESLRAEVEAVGVRVTIVQPGLVDTPLLAATKRPLPPNKLPLAPPEVAAVVLWTLDAPPHTVINEVVLRPSPSRGSDL